MDEFFGVIGASGVILQRMGNFAPPPHVEYGTQNSPWGIGLNLCHFFPSYLPLALTFSVKGKNAQYSVAKSLRRGRVQKIC